MSDWFSSWFDSPYYHLLYQHRDEQEAERFIKALTTHLKLPTGSLLADIPCGKGRHSIYLHALGYQVTGMDLAPESIAEAQKRSATGLHFEVGDMRSIRFKESFDAVLNLFTSFGYFDSEEENKNSLGQLVQAIKPGGFFVMDFMNVRRVLASLVPKEEKELSGVHFSITRMVENGVLVKRIQIQDQDKTFHFQERVKVLFDHELEQYLRDFGCTVQACFGSYTLEAYDKDLSPRCIFIARKS
ncbi:MAG: class I SAM-dependent methyltransferase [Cytophagaceae bacterium]|jgi:SAM-dependent methyltransferase|nr:class I SAM-dependent methyltransferase [Cytophagaceae bacterium]